MQIRQATRSPASVETLYARIRAAIHERGRKVAPEDILDIYGRLADEFDTDVSSPLNMGYYCIDADVVSQAALVETDRRGANIAVDDQHPASVALEHYSVDIILRQFGLNPHTAHGHYTSGGTESNLTAMIVALGERLRHGKLPSGLYDKTLCRDGEGNPERYAYERHGTVPLKAIPSVYIAPQTHVSVRKNARTLLGESAVRLVDMTRNLRMGSRALERIIAADAKSGKFIPFMVVGTIGATDSGIIDPLDEIGEICRRHGIWFHVDAPWGGVAAFSRALRQVCMKGIERADSITFDPHKTLVPLGSGGCGMFLTPHRSAVARSFNVSGGKPRTYDYPYMSLQGSRALSGLRTMVHLADLDLLAKRVEREAALGDRLRRKLRKAGWLITNATPLPVVCTIHPALTKRGVTAARIVRSLALKGIYAMPASLRPDEPESVRLGIISRRTKDEDVDYVVSVLEELV